MKFSWIKTNRKVFSAEQKDGIQDWYFEKGKLGKIIGKLRTSAKYFEFDSMQDAINYAEKQSKL
jgi:hypothetical protein